QTNHSPGDYIKSFFIYGLGIVGIAALFAIIFGGMNYIFAGSSQTRATEGKHWIFSAISGIALLLCSYLILFTINPDLIALKDPTMATITIPPHTGLNYENFTSFKDMPAAKNNIAIFQDPVIMKALQDATSYYKNVPLEIAMFVAGIEHDPKNPYSGTSSKGARGVMQLMPGTATWLGVKNTNDPEQNIWGGVKYLSKLYEQFGNWPDALAGYNAGPNRVIKYGNGWNIPFTETQKYLQAARGKGLI
ncbi:MAG: Transglycosylase, partial [Parcubacteria group bacterium GW2011_GWF2_39_13b]